MKSVPVGIAAVSVQGKVARINVKQDRVLS